MVKPKKPIETPSQPAAAEPFEVREGDALKVLPLLPAESVQTCITSPPYFGLRDYGAAAQIGLEETPEEYVEKLVKVFRQVRRVLKSDGTLWLNLGDTYAGGGIIGRNDTTPEALARRAEKYGTGTGTGSMVGKGRNRPPVVGLKPKDLIGIPWLVAFALRADGWFLRSDIIWNKPNVLPESMTDRPTKSHEYIFLLSKSERYYYDADAIREPNQITSFNGGWQRARANGDFERYDKKYVRHKTEGAAGGSRIIENPEMPLNGRNRRSVWTVATHSFEEAHFATFPPKLIKPCVLAGAPEGGLVLDPFSGAGTTGVVSVRFGRKYLGIEINPDYIQMSLRRINAARLPLFELEGLE